MLPMKQIARQMIAVMAVGSVLFGCLGFTACSGSSSSDDVRLGTKVFRMNLGTEPPTLDPIKMVDLTSYTVIQNMMRGLTLIDASGGKDMAATPAVASHWEILNDGKRYVFHLRKNAVWSDGQPVTAQHFIDGWQRALTPDNAADYAFFLFEIAGAKDFYDGQLTDFSQVGVKALDDKTLQVDLLRAIPFFPALVAAPIALPIRKDMLTAHGEHFTEAGNYITNGPYILDTWRHEEEIILKPNPAFYGEHHLTDNLDAVQMLMINDPNTSVVMYENDELDYIETATSIPSFDVRRLRHFSEAKTSHLHRINYIGFNTKKPPFDNVKVRQAFAMSIDRSYYPQLMQSGQEPITGWITPGLVGYNPEAGLSFQPEKAKKLLAEAGYPDGKGFPTVTLAYPTKYDTQKEMEIAQYLWKTYLNVPVRLENMEWKVYLSTLKQDAPQLFRLGWFVDYPDADSFMSMMLSDSGNNQSRWRDEEYDHLVHEAAVQQDPEVRQSLYDRAQTIMLKRDVAMVPIFRAEKTYLLKPYVKGFKINEINLINLDELAIEKL